MLFYTIALAGYCRAAHIGGAYKTIFCAMRRLPCGRRMFTPRANVREAAPLTRVQRSRVGVPAPRPPSLCSLPCRRCSLRPARPAAVPLAPVSGRCPRLARVSGAAILVAVLGFLSRARARWPRSLPASCVRVRGFVRPPPCGSIAPGYARPRPGAQKTGEHLTRECPSHPFRAGPSPKGRPDPRLVLSADQRTGAMRPKSFAW